MKFSKSNGQFVADIIPKERKIFLEREKSSQ
jgi:hypothetical protein